MHSSIVKTLFKEELNNALDMLTRKADYYGLDEDRLAQLKAVGSATGLDPLRSTHVLVAKHFTALPKMIDNKKDFTLQQFQEYFLDIIVYTCFLYCLMIEDKAEPGQAVTTKRMSK